jgi:PAS domain S-box-containing protein
MSLRLGAAIRAYRDDILRTWEQKARQAPKTAPLPQRILYDSFPDLLDRIAVQTEQDVGGFVSGSEEPARAHALQRLELGFSLGEMVGEYTALRSSIWAHLRADDVDVPPAHAAIVDRVLDEAIEHAVVAYSSAQQRTLLALNEISEIALEHESFDTLLERLIDAFRRTAEGVDQVGLWLMVGDQLVLRAASGYPSNVDTPAAPDSLVLRVADERQPLVITRAAADERQRAELEASGVQVQVAVPLMQGNTLVGVAQMASRSAVDMSDEHRVLFEVMADRATMLIDRARARAHERADAAIVRALASATTLDEALTALLTTIGEQFGWDTGAYWRADAERGGLVLDRRWNAESGAYRAFWQHSAALVFQPNTGLPGRAWQSGTVVWMTGLAVHDQFVRRDAAMACGLQSGIAFPVTGERGEVLGIFEFFTQRLRSSHDEGVYLTRVLARQLPDFLQRISAADRIRRSEARMAAMQASALDAILWMDASGVVTGWNAAAERIFGYTAAHAVGRTLAELIIPERLRDAHYRGLSRYLAIREAAVLNRRIEVMALHASGREFPVELVITHPDVDGPPQFVGYVRDISERQALEAERQRLLYEAQQANEMRDHLLAVVSHDLRNALNAVVVSAATLQMSLARAGVDDRMIGRLLETILRATGQMRQLMGDLLDVAVIQSGRLSMSLAREDVCSLVTEAVDLHRALAQEKALRLDARDIPDEVYVSADRGRLMQVFSNLLGNAVKFCRPGDEILVSATVTDASICIAVSDTGPGIPPDALPHVFEPHWAGQVKGKGTGLGLFISRRIIEAHGGTLEATSNAAGGVTFTFCLPIAAAP